MDATRKTAAFLILAAFTCAPAFANRSECNDAIEKYNSVIDDLSSTLQRYTRCVKGSEGKEDCSSEFRRLRNVQSEFEDTVNAVRNDCD
jgi:hypothetical protein